MAILSVFGHTTTQIVSVVMIPMACIPDTITFLAYAPNTPLQQARQVNDTTVLTYIPIYATSFMTLPILTMSLPFRILSQTTIHKYVVQLPSSFLIFTFTILSFLFSRNTFTMKFLYSSLPLSHTLLTTTLFIRIKGLLRTFRQK